jgi:hypothetical protein
VPAIQPSIGLRVFDFDSESPQARKHGAVELLLVLLGRVLVECRREGIAESRKDLRAGLDEVQVIGVALLGLIAAGPVVSALRRVAVGDQPGFLALEEVELAPDDILEAARAQTSSS